MDRSYATSTGRSFSAASHNKVLHLLAYAHHIVSQGLHNMLTLKLTVCISAGSLRCYVLMHNISIWHLNPKLSCPASIYCFLCPLGAIMYCVTQLSATLDCRSSARYAMRCMPPWLSHTCIPATSTRVLSCAMQGFAARTLFASGAP